MTDEVLKALLPCPFCGAEMRRSSNGRPLSWHPGVSGDMQCLFSGQGINDGDYAAMWNQRASIQPADDAVVEWVARAIHEARWKPEDADRLIPLEQDSPSSQEYAHRLARAAIAALASPQGEKGK